MKSIAFLRAINLGKHNKIKMSELIDVLLNYGYCNVKTYLNTGNVLFDALGNDEEILHTLIMEHFLLDIKVIVFSIEQLKDAMSYCKEDKNAAVVFLKEIPDSTLVEKISKIDIKNDSFVIYKNFVFIYYEVYQTTVLSNAFFEKHLKTTASTRTLNVVKKLLSI